MSYQKGTRGLGTCDMHGDDPALDTPRRFRTYPTEESVVQRLRALAELCGSAHDVSTDPAVSMEGTGGAQGLVHCVLRSLHLDEEEVSYLMCLVQRTTHLVASSEIPTIFLGAACVFYRVAHDEDLTTQDVYDDLKQLLPDHVTRKCLGTLQLHFLRCVDYRLGM